MSKKKKVVFHSDSALAFTGFGRNAKAVLTYLYLTGKYDLVAYCCGGGWSSPEMGRTPWKSYGTLPDSRAEMEVINAKDEGYKKLVGYGAYNIDKVIKEEKPDCFISVQDIWGIDYSINKPWFKEITSVLWTTLDSLPILPKAVAAAEKCDNFWVWSKFAERELHSMGHKHVKTVHGAIDDSNFKPLLKSEKDALRAKFGIEKDAFVVGFVFRNQLRKSVNKLLEGYSIWKKKNNIKKSYLLLHTNFSEPRGWNIPEFARRHGVDPKEILCTYICCKAKGACLNYQIKPFNGEEQDCPYCGKAKSQITVNTRFGVSEKRLNEIYNIMNLYAHSMTSGGQELPVQEAKLAGLITLVTNYSCGEEMCSEEARSLPLSWTPYDEHGTQFIKASTSPESIAKQINRVYNMDEGKRKKMGLEGRNWALKEFSTNAVGKKIEDFIDNCKFTNYDFRMKEDDKDPKAVYPLFQDEKKWLKAMYKYILKSDVKDDDNGLNYWLKQLAEKKTNRGSIENYFRGEAEKLNNKNNPVKFEDLLGKDDDGKRMIIVMPDSAGDVFMITSLFESCKKQYPDYNLYIATKPENFCVVESNENVYKVINYIPQMDNILFLEGSGGNKGYFEVAFAPYLTTQRHHHYTHNNLDKIEFDITNNLG